MRLQCNACEAAEASVLCCADVAALCRACDEKVHAANKLAGKHQRVNLTTAASSPVPKCDICQEASGYFFCLEDRALLCRECNIAIHSVNSFVSAHRRFLLTGVRVAPKPSESIMSFAKQQLNLAPPPKSSSEKALSVSLSGENGRLSSQVGRNGSLPESRTTFSGVTMTGSIPNWPFDELPQMDWSQNYGFTGHESSKADSGKLGYSQESPICRAVSEEPDSECASQVPEIQLTVPEISSPPTASGFSWQKSSLHPFVEHMAFVPDICPSSCQDNNWYQHSAATFKRRRPN